MVLECECLKRVSNYMKFILNVNNFMKEVVDDMCMDWNMLSQRYIGGVI